MTETIKENAEMTAEETELKEVADAIRSILESKQYALQPHLIYSQHGIQPSVRLISTKDEQTGDSGETEEAGKQPEPTEPSESPSN